MTEKNAILLRILLRTCVFLMAIGVLVREISCNRPQRKADDAPAGSAVASHTYITYAFDTKCSLSLWGDEVVADQAATEAIQLLNRLHATLNRFDEASELSQFNATPPNVPFVCSDLLWMAFVSAKDAYAITNGTFDVTIGPLMTYWKRVAMHPEQEHSPAELANAQACTGFDKLLLNEAEHTVTKSQEGMMVDFGGLAKGLALDLVSPLVKRQGISRILLDLGGNLYLDNPDELPEAGDVFIRNPTPGEQPAEQMLIKLTNANRRFIATSANSERPLSAKDDHFIGHIMDPRTGKPATAMMQVTAVTTSGAHSDVFSTAVFIGGTALAEQLAHDHPNTGFVLLADDATAPLSIGNAELATLNPKQPK